MTQITDTILMVRMATFRSNDETAQNNHYQKNSELAPAEMLSQAQGEFDGFVETLRSNGINILVIDGDSSSDTPDAHFPNNWITFHADGTVVLYPMYAPSRRRERRKDVMDFLRSQGYRFSQIIDYSDYENHHQFLEGTGSIIIDRENKKAYCGLSLRADDDLFEKFCGDMGYQPVSFIANQTVDSKRMPIYHTNVMMAIAERYAIICLDSIDDVSERKMVADQLNSDGKEIIEVSEDQLTQFAGNMLQVKNNDGQRFLVMSTAAYNSLTPDQITKIKSYNDIIHSDLSLIETCGGGSARCMMAEVFLEKS